jgi:hypothetical protein
MLSRRSFIAGSAMLLAACAGSAVRKEGAGDAATVGTLRVGTVQVRISPKARDQLPDNIKFDPSTMSSTIGRALSGSNLQDTAAANTLDVEVTNVYIRGTFSAVMFGLLAGADNLSGNVRVLGPGGQVLRSFDVSASYAFGGFAGGQDSIRINYLYEKFAELTRDQLQDRK